MNQPEYIQKEFKISILKLIRIDLILIINDEKKPCYRCALTETIKFIKHLSKQFFCKLFLLCQK